MAEMSEAPCKLKPVPANKKISGTSGVPSSVKEQQNFQAMDSTCWESPIAQSEDTAATDTFFSDILSAIIRPNPFKYTFGDLVADVVAGALKEAGKPEETNPDADGPSSPSS